LSFQLSPKLPASFFKEGIISFKLFDAIVVTYHNPKHLNTYDTNTYVSKITLHKPDGTIDINGDQVSGHWAKDIRDGKVTAIDICFDKK
jgi:hypothetical protein